MQHRQTNKYANYIKMGIWAVGGIHFVFVLFTGYHSPVILLKCYKQTAREMSGDVKGQKDRKYCLLERVRSTE